jgi:peptidoglycan/LPS O-acetylase OafA/YrhL
MNLYWRRLLAAIIGLAVFLFGIVLLASIGQDTLTTALMVLLGVALATIGTTLGFRVMGLGRAGRRWGIPLLRLLRRRQHKLDE